MVTKINELEYLVSSPDFWNDSMQAQSTMKTLSNLNKTVEDWESLESEIDSTIEMLELIEIDFDTEIFEKYFTTKMKRLFSYKSKLIKAKR